MPASTNTVKIIGEGHHHLHLKKTRRGVPQIRERCTTLSTVRMYANSPSVCPRLFDSLVPADQHVLTITDRHVKGFRKGIDDGA